jgi:hypothetical protein
VFNGIVTRSCSAECSEFEVGSYGEGSEVGWRLSTRCCTSPLCNDYRSDIERCYVCDSFRSVNCYDGSKLDFYSDSKACPSGSQYCVTQLDSIGIVRRSCAAQCTSGSSNGIKTECCSG